MHDEYPFTIHEGYCHKKTLKQLSWFKNVNSNNFSLEWKFLFVDHRAPPIIGKICRTVLIDARKYIESLFYMSGLFLLIVESLYYSSLNGMWAFFCTLGKQISLFWRKEIPHRPSV